MNIQPVSSFIPSDPSQLQNDVMNPVERPTVEQVRKAAQQFEAILVRQFLEPSMRSIMSGGMGSEGGQGGGVFSYMLTDSIADAISSGGGMGISSIMEIEFRGQTSQEEAQK